MKYDDRYIVELSRAAIFDDTPFVPEEDVNWEYIYNKSIEQNITGLLFTAVSKLSNEYKPDKELYAKWQKKMLETIAVTSRQYNEFLKISKVFWDKKIKAEVLKGGFIRRLYPVPELRTMGDFDLLVCAEDFEKIKTIFANENYKIERDSFGIICSKRNLTWEVFTTVQEEFRINTNKYDKIFFEELIFKDNICTVSPSVFLLHLIIHTGKHYIGSGAGIRNLCDISCFIKEYKNDIDFEFVKNACKEQGFFEIYQYIFCAVKTFYYDDCITVENENIQDNLELFVEYFLANGIYGKRDNVLITQVAKPDDDSITGYRKILFPSVKILRDRYSYLKKFPILLPIAWIHRLMRAIFKRKYSFFSMVKGLNSANNFSKERLDKLKKLGIKIEK